jgi:NADPH:quinone reductase-like Zn-dependent oxidoreductase/glyoxylase-like metal-dependent hydrolase (beta-lactamase superfamily II)
MRATSAVASIRIFAIATLLAADAWAAPQSMRAVVVGEGGSLSVREVPVPRPANGEVLVEVRAASVNPADWKSAPSRIGAVPGTDLAGVIDTLGGGVTGWKVGEPVLGFARRSGSYAEYAVVPVDSLARKPNAMSFEQAAGVPIAGETAYRALHEAGRILRGQTVLIHGAAGGVGSAAVQIARAAGAHVIGTASANNLRFLKALGAEEAVDYRARRFEDVVRAVDLVLNAANAETSRRSIGVLREGGTLVTLVGGIDQAACVAARIRCTRPDRSIGAANAELLARLGALADAGKFKVIVDGLYPMERAGEAWARSREGHVRGKLIIQVGSAAVAQAPSLDGAAQRLGVDALQSLEFEASGRYYQFSQAPAPELPWPAFDVDGYVATLDFARGAVHARYHRVQVQEPGRARPHSEQTMDQFAVDGVTWNLAPGPTAIPANLAERNAELWASPQGFIKAARAHGAKLARRSDGGLEVSFALGPYPYEGIVDAAGEVTLVRSLMDSPVLGDTPIEFRYSGYREFDGVRFPARIERRVAKLPWYELEVTAVHANTARAFGVPAQVAADPVPSTAAIAVEELAPGVLLFGGGSHHSVIVEQGGGIVVVEAPLGEQRSAAVLARVRELFPAQPILAVINTHAHFDHAGGLRTFVDEGIPVITQARNARYYAEAWAAPRTLNPDRLSRSGRKPVLRGFEGRLVLADARHPVEVHEIRGSGHDDAFAMVYLPADRLLIEADAWTPAPPGTRPPAVVNPLWRNLADNIERLGLDVQRIAPLHGAPQTMAALRAALGGS